MAKKKGKELYDQPDDDDRIKVHIHHLLPAIREVAAYRTNGGIDTDKPPSLSNVLDVAAEATVGQILGLPIHLFKTDEDFRDLNVVASDTLYHPHLTVSRDEIIVPRYILVSIDLRNGQAFIEGEANLKQVTKARNNWDWQTMRCPTCRTGFNIHSGHFAICWSELERPVEIERVGDLDNPIPPRSQWH